MGWAQMILALARFSLVGYGTDSPGLGSATLGLTRAWLELPWLGWPPLKWTMAVWVGSVFCEYRLRWARVAKIGLAGLSSIRICWSLL